MQGTKLKAQNYYFQGLSYAAIQQPNRAKLAFRKSSRSKSDFAALAILELIGLENDLRDFTAAKKWISTFRKRFANHRFIQLVNQVAVTIDTGKYIPIKETQRARYQNLIFKNHNMSLTETPHFWFLQTGIDYAAGTRSNPAYFNEPIVETGAGF